VGLAVEWAHRLREKDLVEEFSVGPATLEDVYVRLIGRSDALEMPLKEAKHVVQTQLVQ
jgi:hypothetical protein